MIQNNFKVEYLYTARDVINCESMAVLRDYITVDEYSDISVTTDNYDSNLIKFLESNNMVYEVEGGILEVYLAHPNYLKSKVSALREFTALYIGLLKFRIIDEIFTLKTYEDNLFNCSLDFERDAFIDTENIQSYIFNVWLSAFGFVPRITKENDYILYEYQDNTLLDINTEESLVVVPEEESDQQEDS